VIKHGGHADQLSQSEPAIDRFRAYSLMKNYLSLSLSKERKNLIKEQLQRKANILREGALKRDNINDQAVYSRLCVSIDNGLNNEAGRELIHLLAKEIKDADYCR
jgi:hypothetical protein